MDRPSLWSIRALLALGVAVAGAAVAIAVSGADGKPAASVPSTQPPAASTAVTTAPPPVTTAPPPVTTAPPPVTTAPPRTGVWPAGRDAWTIVLASLPESGGRAAAEAQARRARAAGLSGAGVLRSSDFASLNPGYYVVFAAAFDSLDAAAGALAEARAAFPTAYTRRVSR